jgi:endo-alpha-1,4-polygalactosaminidase (GH114 family)
LKKVIEQLKIIVTMNNILSTNHTSIYKLLFVLFFAGICNLPFKCNAQEYSKLDEVPQWVKEKVSHEEYKLWEVMSSVFQIDYSFLKKDISQERKKEILHLLQNTVTEMTNILISRKDRQSKKLPICFL